MDLIYLKEFVVLAQTGNFLEAADILYTSQSTLSKHIKSMESELGVLLFDRTTRKVSLSKFGQLLLPHARQVTELFDDYIAVLKNSLETERDTLNVGTIPALAQYKITDVLVRFKKGHPQSTLNMLQADSDELKKMLHQGKCELAFIRFTDEEEDTLIRIPYAIDPLVAVLPLTHPLAKEKTIPLQALAKDEFLLIEKENYLYRLCMNACLQSGFEPNITFTDHKIEALLDLVGKGMGVALIMKQLATYASDPKTAIVKLSPGMNTQIDVCHIKDAKLSDAARYFMQCAQSQSADTDFLSREEIYAEHAP